MLGFKCKTHRNSAILLCPRRDCDVLGIIFVLRITDIHNNLVMGRYAFVRKVIHCGLSLWRQRTAHSLKAAPLVRDDLRLSWTPTSCFQEQNVRSVCGADRALCGALLSSRLSYWSRGVLEPMKIPGNLAERTAGIHTGRRGESSVEPSYGVGPVGGADRDPKTRGSTPDDSRADYIHMAEPKEITKEKAAIAQQEPPDFQVKKTMPLWDKPVEEKADAQREPGESVFEGKTRKVEGTAQKQGDTTGNESGPKVESQYGATPEVGKTGRS